MSRSALLRLAAVAAVAASPVVLAAQQHSYKTIADHFKMPDGRKVGSTAGITIDRDGSSVWVFERCGANDCVGSTVAPILKFDASGKAVKSSRRRHVHPAARDPHRPRRQHLGHRR